jgi:hypothetical protein|tara:strand:+ start:1515 stop:1772 length:258 start_codon:yes stop_codon:yes gene_type:complete
MAGLVSASFKQSELNMKILILADTIANKQKVSVGDVIEVDRLEGQDLIGYKKASVFVGKEKKETNRSIGLESSDQPTPKKRARKK